MYLCVYVSLTLGSFGMHPVIVFFPMTCTYVHYKEEFICIVYVAITLCVPFAPLQDRGLEDLEKQIRTWSNLWESPEDFCEG